MDLIGDGKNVSTIYDFQDGIHIGKIKYSGWLHATVANASPGWAS